MKGFIHLLVIFMLIAPVAVKAQGISVIRDTEIERTLKSWASPVIEAAGLSPDQVEIILVGSDDINAFVAGGSNLFIYAGLLQKADYPEEVTGVMAHEIGHIQGGHLIETRRAMERATYQSILAAVAGIGAAIATGDGGAATAVSLGGSGVAQRGFFSHSRTQESSADQAALKYMKDAKLNPKGLVTFLEKLEGQELLPASQQSEYMRTHPLTRDRIIAMREGARQSPHTLSLGDSAKQKDFDFMRAKLRAFREPHMVPRYYNIDSGKDVDLYAHAIMRYRQKDYNGALELFDRLIEGNANSPNYLELKAQTLRDYGRLAESELNYKKTLDLVDGKAPLIKVNLAHVMIEQQKYGQEVEDLLLSALQEDTHETRAYRLMATLRGRQGYEADAQYFLAEEAAATGHKEEARRLLELAIRSKNLSNDIKFKAQDLKIYLDSLPEHIN